MNIRKILHRSICVSIFAAFTAAVFPAQAWNNVGHRVVAELAWRQLSAKERNKISDVLKEHPHYNEYLINDVPAGVNTNEWAFLKAAIWPDWIRGKRHKASPDSERITKFDLHPHALGLPFLKPGETNIELLNNFEIDHPTAADVLSNSMVSLRNHRLTDAQRAVSLCWTLHLMGDLHQPLHCASMVSEERTKWDGLGGNYKVINPTGKREETDMHRFWDALLGTEPTYAQFTTLADQISANPQFDAKAMPEYRNDKTVYSWVEEGLRIATNFAYSPAHVQFAHVDDLKSGKISQSQIPELSSDYIQQAQKIARTRVALAGQRLADELKRDF